MQLILKWSQTLGIFAACGFIASSVTTHPLQHFALAMRDGSATGTAFQALLLADERT